MHPLVVSSYSLGGFGFMVGDGVECPSDNARTEIENLFDSFVGD